MNLQTEAYKSFENDKFNIFEVETILTNNNFDPDNNFFNEKITQLSLHIIHIRNLYLFPAI